VPVEIADVHVGPFGDPADAEAHPTLGLGQLADGGDDECASFLFGGLLGGYGHRPSVTIRTVRTRIVTDW
jgi:hypothetical protein